MTIRSAYVAVSLTLVWAAFMLAPGRAEARQDHDDAHHQFTWIDGDERLEVDIRGDVVFTEDDAGVARISPGGYIKIEERRQGVRRTLDVRPGAGGTLRYTYHVDGRERSFHNESREFAAALFLRIIRNTGVGAEQRVARILRQDGVDGVFAEVAHIESSSAARRYLTALLEQGRLNTAQLQRMARVVVQQVASSGMRARFLQQAAAYYLADARTYAAYFDAVNTIPSPGDHARVLTHVLEEHPPDRAALVRLLQSARKIESSGVKSRVLIAAAPRYDNIADVRDAFFDAVNTIPSPGDHARALSALLENAALDQASVTALFQSAKAIESSGVKARLLSVAAPHFVNEAGQRTAFFDAVGTIPSPGDHALVLQALLQEDLDKASLRALLASARQIESSGVKARVLVEAAPLVASDDDLVAAYLEAADTIPSPGDHSRALSALINQEGAGARLTK